MYSFAVIHQAKISVIPPFRLRHKLNFQWHEWDIAWGPDLWASSQEEDCSGLDVQRFLLSSVNIFKPNYSSCL